MSHLAHYLDRRYAWDGSFSGGADIMIKKIFDKTGEELRNEGIEIGEKKENGK